MSYRSSADGGYGIGAATDHVNASHTDRIDIHNAELLFRGHFARSGPDLILTGQDGHRLIVTDYFASEKHPDLVAPNGAHLTGDVVDLLAGSPTHGQYAQAGTVLPPEAIGKVEKVVGQVTLIHNGVAGPLHVGDPVYKTDIVQTGANSSCGIAFPDGTALDLVNNTRMALNEYNYQGDSASNGALFSLVEGTFAFVAGKVAHTGEGMKINTPVATMGIRGTVGLFRSEPTVVNANLGHVWSAFLHEDIDGSHHLGRIALIDQDPSSPTFGETIYLLDSSDYIAYLEPQGPGHPPHVRLEPITSSKTFENRHFFDDLGTIINSYNNADPQSPSNPGSGDNPSDLFQRELFQDNGNAPLFKFAELNDHADSDTFRSDLPFIPVMAGLPEANTTPSSVESSTVFIWNGTGAWPTALANWSGGAAPSSPNDSVIIQTGTATYNLPNTVVSSLTVASGAALDVVGGQLTTGGLIDNGTINVDGDPPVFIVTGSAMIGSGATITAQDGSVIFASGGLLNAGKLTAEAGGALLIDEIGINSGIIRALDGGVVTIENGTIVNAVADGQGNMTDGTVFVGDRSQLALDNAALVNGIVHVGTGGEIDTASGTNNTVNASLTVDKCGFIVVRDDSSLALAGAFGIDNNGTIELGSTGHATVLYFDQSHAILAGSGIVVLEGGSGSQDIIAGLPGQGVTTVNLDNRGNTIEGAGAIGQNDGALSFTNDGCGVIDADLGGQRLVVETGNTFINNALLEATNGGILDVLDNVVGNGWVAISGGGVAVFAGAFSQNVAFSGAGTLELGHSLGGAYCGTITGFGVGDALVLDDLAYSSCEYAVWCNGVLTIYDGRTVETIKMAGDYSHDSFAVVDDGGKAEVVFANDEWIGPSPEGRTGTWQTGANWSSGVPTAKLNVIVDFPGAYMITTSGDHAAESLVITDSDATLTGAGSLALGTLEDQGTIRTTAGERLVINVRNGGTNSGTIAADGGSISVHAPFIDNTEGLIVTLGLAASIILADTAIAGGKIDALHDGVVYLDHATITDSMIETACGGVVHTVCGNSTLYDVTIARGGDVVVNQDSSLTLIGDIHNGGAIVVGVPHFDSAADLIIKGDVALAGPGSIVLNAADAAIVGSCAGGTLTNDNTIFGAGHIGNGAENFHLVNENCGTIDANSCAQALVLDTGCNQVVNSGTLAADNGGDLDVKSAVANAGGSIKVSDGGFAVFEKDVAGGTAAIQGGHLQFDAASSADVAFDNRGGHYGELVLGDVKDFSGTIDGFNGQHSLCPSLSTSDEIDLLGVKGCDVCFSAGANGDAIITIMKDAHTVLATITIDNFDFRDFQKESDGVGGTIIIGEPTSAKSNPSVSIGGTENDTFLFHSGEATQPLDTANPQHHTVGEDHFVGGHDVDELTAAVTPDLHGNALTDVGLGDGGAASGTSSTLLQQNLQHLASHHS